MDRVLTWTYPIIDGKLTPLCLESIYMMSKPFPSNKDVIEAIPEVDYVMLDFDNIVAETYDFMEEEILVD